MKWTSQAVAVAVAGVNGDVAGVTDTTGLTATTYITDTTGLTATTYITPIVTTYISPINTAAATISIADVNRTRWENMTGTSEILGATLKSKESLCSLASLLAHVGVVALGFLRVGISIASAATRRRDAPQVLARLAQIPKKVSGEQSSHQGSQNFVPRQTVLR
jgi:hypothetical protein